MPRYKLTIEYDGTDFAGWQRQENGPSIQQSLEEALARLGQRTPLVAGAGRTDAGVHALGQVAHVDLAREWTAWRLKEAINGQLAPRRSPCSTSKRSTTISTRAAARSCAGTSIASSTAARR